MDHIREDDSDGDQDEIRALEGMFFVRDTTAEGWVESGEELWFDEGDPNGVRAYVG
jgi:hypothetical protein